MRELRGEVREHLLQSGYTVGRLPVKQSVSLVHTYV